ncbi:MAG: hypothetical protein IJ785_00920 [Bacteroidales bacterium]|nr:hypothetical protein [Bacteroidales bacterium]
MLSRHINTLIIRFRNKILQWEIPYFRGAIMEAVGENCSQLFHNHVGNGFRYKYPLIQYKRINGQAAIVCIGQGVEEIGAFFRNSNFSLKLGNKPATTFEIESIIPHRTLVQVWNESFTYHLRNWLPLNPDNHQKYTELEGIVERTQMLEKILIGNILSACKGLGITVEGEIACKILQTEEPQVTHYKQLPYLSLNGEFKSNISLPNHIGLGKGASTGHGTIVMKKEK